MANEIQKEGTKKPPLKFFVIRSRVNRTMVEAFTESEEYFLGIGGAENSGLGTYNVMMFDKEKWERLT